MISLKHIPVVIVLIAILVETAYGDSLSIQNDLFLSALRLRQSSLTSHSSELDKHKCGTPLMLEIRDQWDKFSATQQAALAKVLAPDPRQKSRAIGHFRIYYDTLNTPHVPALLEGDSARIPFSAEAYVDSVGKIFNDVYDFEFNTLGYDRSFLNGTGEYPIYITDMIQYGVTSTTIQIDQGTPPRFLSYVEVENDFLGFYSPGMSGLKVTAAHEFYHTIQFGAYAYWGTQDQYFMEITATWMEDAAYPDVNDYYNYLRSPIGQPRGHFANPDITFTSIAGEMPYSRAIWGKFIEQRFSRDAMRRIWEWMRVVPSLEAIDNALLEYGSSLRSSFAEWAFWNARTGTKSDTSVSYIEGRDYPLIRTRPRMEYVPPSRTLPDSAQALGSTYRTMVLPSSGDDDSVRIDSMTVIVSNLRTIYSASNFRFHYIVSSSGDGSYKQLTNGLFIKLDVADPQNWVSQELFDSSRISIIYPELVVFPNPFRFEKSPYINFRLPSKVIPPSSQPNVATLSIFSSSLDRVIQVEMDILPGAAFGQAPSIRWDGTDDNGERVASGIYFYVISIDGEQLTGKLAVLQE